MDQIILFYFFFHFIVDILKSIVVDDYFKINEHGPQQQETVTNRTSQK